MEIKKTTYKSKEGFALLITIIVVGVVLSVGLTILDLSIKQVRLSTNSRDSEVSFHAANAGAECARYWRRYKSDSLLADDMVRGVPISLTCFGVSPEDGDTVSGGIVSKTDIAPDDADTGEVFKYEYEFEWGGGSRCTEITTVVASSTLGSGGLTVTGMNTHVPGYPDLTSTCEEGSQCTILSVRGYNKPCSNIGGFGVVQREVLLQF